MTSGPGAPTRVKALIWTRSLDDWPEDEALLRGAGVLPQTLHLPCISLRPLAVPAAATAATARACLVTSVAGARLAAADSNLVRLLQSRCPVFTHSVKAAQFLRDNLPGADVRLLADARTAADLAAKIGPLLPPGDELIYSLGAQEPAFDSAAFLRAAGLKAAHLACYATVAALSAADGTELSAAQRSAYGASLDGVACFTSPSAVRGFVRGLADAAVPLRQRLVAVVIGPTTAAAAREAGFQRVETAERNELAAVVTLAARLLPVS
jgi:uroporphyrinogen-III synthase